MQIDFPFHLDHRRRTAETDEDDHLRDLIAQVLFTNPGERVQRPDFGAGLDRLLFGPSSPQVASTVQGIVHGALQQWLGDRIRVESVEVTSRDEHLTIEIAYSRLQDQQQQMATFEGQVAS